MFNWLSNRFGKRDHLQASVPHIAAVAQHQQFNAIPIEAGSPPLHSYRTSPWVYLAVNRIAEAGALVPLNVYRLQGEQRIEVKNHPLERLLSAPNPTMSRFELFEQTLGSLELTGNAYWYLAGDAYGRPAEIWVLRPDRVSIVPDPVKHVKGYVYELDGQRIPLEPVEVVHFKRWHPTDDYYGLSALSAARLAVQNDRAMATWNQGMFGNDNGVPAGIVNIKDFVTDADFERIKREWRTSYGGTQRRTAFLRGGAVEWQSIGMTHHDLDFLQGRKAQRDEILNLFGIPIGLISENATEANAKVAERQFIERTLYPKLVRIAQKITQELLPFWGADTVALFEDIRPTDTQAKLDELRAAYPVLSINEVRERYFNLSPVAWGERPATAPTIINTPENDAISGTKAHIITEPEEMQIKRELERWERFLLKRWGRANIRNFAPEHLPDSVTFEVSARLLGAETPDDVRGVFQAVREVIQTA